MILRQLVLHNFGVYHGRQVVDLEPPSATKSIILFGGLNGGGKTTLLDALQLVLYGKFAECSNRGSLPYEEFLSRSIHGRSDPRDGAAIELEFTRVSEGKATTYRVSRTWAAKGKSVKENLEVTADGVFDRVLTDGWAEHIEELIPVRLSKFFFFDGEKIEALADPDRAAEALSTAIHSLLGLDLVDQLGTDLAVLERRKRSAQMDVGERKAVDAAQAEVERLKAEREALTQQLAGVQNSVDRYQKRAREAEDRFKREGGDAFDRRNEIEVARANANSQVERVLEDLRDETSGTAPLLMVTGLLDLVAAGYATEHEAKQASELRALLEVRDARVVEMAKSKGATPSVISALSEFMVEDRSRYAVADQVEPYLNLSAESGSEVRRVQEQLGVEAPERIQRLLNLHEKRRLLLQELDRRLEQVPGKEVMEKLALALAEARENLARAQNEHEEMSSKLEQVSRELDQKLDAWMRRSLTAAGEEREQESVARVLTYSDKVRQTLKQFRAAVLLRHVGRIERHILEGFQFLLRKQSLVTGLKIDPTSFRMTLMGSDDRDLSPERLSAGERQLLAISTIWGLARTAGRPLPVVIDTPLGRLDSAHRGHLIERYFPVASHQVLLLSTDKEIDEQLYNKLKPSIGRSYILAFDDRAGSTTVRSGYFW